MAGARAIKTRIKSTKNIQQITKAMEAVSAVKMRKSEAAALHGRPYALYALQILRKIESGTEESLKALSPFFEKVEGVNKVCFIVVASDKGLAGSFNSNVLKKAHEVISKETLPVSVVAVGKKARDYFERKGIPLEATFEGIGDFATMEECSPIAELATSLFLQKKYSKINIVYTNFVSALKQEAVLRPLLPLSRDTLEEVTANIIPETGKFSHLRNNVSNDTEYKFEPTPTTIIKELVPLLVEIEIFHSILEANASEHSARMVAMKNASDNAKDIIGKLTIKYNKERQAQITKELIEITSGKEALSKEE